MGFHRGIPPGPVVGDALARDLAGVSPDQYGANYDAHLLEQYKLYVQAAEKISDRRLVANAFFVTVNTVLMTLLGLLGSHQHAWTINICGVLISLVWYFLLRSYRGLNSGKFRVIHEIEVRLPLRMYEAEWTTLGKGEVRQVYLPFTTIEPAIPWIFGALFTLLLLVH